MRPDRSSHGQRAKRARQPTLAGRAVPGTTQAVNGHATGKAVTFGPFRFLPAQRMVGRDDVVSELAGLLPQRRLMTIVGPGGIGKTTVALAVAQKLIGSYPDGICFVDLASVLSPELVTSTVATALGVRLLSQEPV